MTENDERNGDGAQWAPKHETLDLAVPEPTGDAAIDQAIRELTAAGNRPLAEQFQVFDAVHRILQDRLSDEDD